MEFIFLITIKLGIQFSSSSQDSSVQRLTRNDQWPERLRQIILRFCVQRFTIKSVLGEWEQSLNFFRSWEGLSWDDTIYTILFQKFVVRSLKLCKIIVLLFFIMLVTEWGWTTNPLPMKANIITTLKLRLLMSSFLLVFSTKVTNNEECEDL